MTTGSINYSPDYKSEKPLNKRIKIRANGVPYVDAEDLVASRLAAIDERSMSDERARLEREIVAAARMFTKEDAVNWDRLVAYRRLFAAVDALIEFESQHK